MSLPPTSLHFSSLNRYVNYPTDFRVYIFVLPAPFSGDGTFDKINELRGGLGGTSLLSPTNGPLSLLQNSRSRGQGRDACMHAKCGRTREIFDRSPPYVPPLTIAVVHVVLMAAVRCPCARTPEGLFVLFVGSCAPIRVSWLASLPSSSFIAPHNNAAGSTRRWAGGVGRLLGAGRVGWCHRRR